MYRRIRSNREDERVKYAEEEDEGLGLSDVSLIPERVLLRLGWCKLGSVSEVLADEGHLATGDNHERHYTKVQQFVQY